MTEMATARYYPVSLNVHSSRPLDRHSLYLALGVAVVSACTVFFTLCERDYSFLAQTSQTEHQTYAPQAASSAAPTATPSHTGPVQSATQTAALQPNVQGAPEYIPFVITRSRHFQRLGPITVGLWKTDSRRGTYDVSLVVDGHRFDKKRVGMDEALAIRIGNAPPMELIVNRVARNEISGYLSEPR